MLTFLNLILGFTKLFQQLILVIMFVINFCKVAALNDNLCIMPVNDCGVDKVLNCFIVFATILVLVSKIQFRDNIGKDFFIFVQTLRRQNQ